MSRSCRRHKREYLSLRGWKDKEEIRGRKSYNKTVNQVIHGYFSCEVSVGQRKLLSGQIARESVNFEWKSIEVRAQTSQGEAIIDGNRGSWSQRGDSQRGQEESLYPKQLGFMHVLDDFIAKRRVHCRRHKNTRKICLNRDRNEKLMKISVFINFSRFDFFIC